MGIQTKKPRSPTCFRKQSASCRIGFKLALKHVSVLSNSLAILSQFWKRLWKRHRIWDNLCYCVQTILFTISFCLWSWIKRRRQAGFNISNHSLLRYAYYVMPSIHIVTYFSWLPSKKIYENVLWIIIGLLSPEYGAHFKSCVRTALLYLSVCLLSAVQTSVLYVVSICRSVFKHLITIDVTVCVCTDSTTTTTTKESANFSCKDCEHVRILLF